ncbi:similar to Saccharomyces cerevisiae YDR264C AKR1 Palmitoyl transferase involved in protein palmitoylation [Maudiozyma saulgeensis]|uniref:Palmitoyltransferase n=1 Tax=Maudiozyma saulgeensis TaxID=1789683 RepID=A0A1X7QWN6_9SACH|nr:similar to Saccharomyces cerevisiae YDR264C AKR1 Palmitoyl transferase involved in protein palmitoylation [Kazachstania saulgeensis]
MSDTLIQEYYLACQNGDLEALTRLITTNQIDVTNDSDPKTGMTGLHWAAMNNRLLVCDLLLKNGAVIDAKTLKQYSLSEMTPLHIATKYSYLYMVHYLLKQNADPIALTYTGANLLHLAVESSNALNVIHTILFVNEPYNVPVDQQDTFGTTALQMAIKQEDITSVKILLQYGANLTVRDTKERSALKYAASRHNKDINILLSRHLMNKNQNTPTIDEAPDLVAFYMASKYSRKNVMLAKRITFIVPTFVLFISAIFGRYNAIIGLIVFFMLAKISDLILYKILLPLYSFDKSPRKALTQSPIVSGLFFALLNCITVVWFAKLETVMVQSNMFVAIIFQLTLLLTYYMFMKLLISNPGNIPKESNFDIIREEVTTLIQQGKFNDYYFCLETWLRKPLRSKFSDISQCQVARYDHYCSWLNNDIGLLNHKIFIVFLFLLETSLLSFIYLMIGYFNQINSFSIIKTLSPFDFTFPKAPENHSLGALFLLLIFAVYESIYVMNVIVQQTYSISKGLTCFDIKTLYELEKNSTVLFSKPFIQNDYYNINYDELTLLSGKPIITESSTNIKSMVGKSVRSVGNEYSKLVSRITSRRLLESRHPIGGKRDKLMKFFGFNMWTVVRHCNEEIAVYDDCELPNEILEPTRYGTIRNMKDFWLTAKLDSNIFKRLLTSNKDSIALLNGLPVDYHHLWKLPIKDNSSLQTEGIDSGLRLV